MDDILELGAALAFDLDHFIADRILHHARRIVQRPEYEIRVTLIVFHHLPLEALMDGCLLGHTEAGAHINAVSAKCERSNQAAAIGKAAGCQHRDLHLVGGGRDQDEARNVVLAGVASAFETVD